MSRYRYDWDEEENKRNLRLFGLDFRDAVLIFEGPVLSRFLCVDKNGRDVFAYSGIVNGRIVKVFAALLEPGFLEILEAKLAPSDEAEAYWNSFD